MEAAIVPLWPIRVLVAGTDRRFLRLARAILERDGYVIELTEKHSDVCPCAQRRRADVVVIDASGCVQAALRALSPLEALDRPVPVIVVADAEDAARCGGIPKWEAIARLAPAIRQSYMSGKSAVGGKSGVR